MAVPQSHCRLRLILDLSAQPDSDTPSVNETTYREALPESLQFGWAFPCILQVVWEADPVQGPVRVSKLDVTDAYDRGTVKPAQVDAFAYVIPSEPGDKGIIICIGLVLLMGWVDSPKFFCTFWQTPWSTQTSLSRPTTQSPRSQKPGQSPLTPRIASPISIFIWMTPYQWCGGGGQIANTESLMAKSVPSSGSSRHYRGGSKTW